MGEHTTDDEVRQGLEGRPSREHEAAARGCCARRRVHFDGHTWPCADDAPVASVLSRRLLTTASSAKAGARTHRLWAMYSQYDPNMVLDKTALRWPSPAAPGARASTSSNSPLRKSSRLMSCRLLRGFCFFPSLAIAEGHETRYYRCGGRQNEKSNKGPTLSGTSKHAVLCAPLCVCCSLPRSARRGPPTTRTAYLDRGNVTQHPCVPSSSVKALRPLIKRRTHRPAETARDPSFSGRELETPFSEGRSFQFSLQCPQAGEC